MVLTTMLQGRFRDRRLGGCADEAETHCRTGHAHTHPPAVRPARQQGCLSALLITRGTRDFNSRMTSSFLQALSPARPSVSHERRDLFCYRIKQRLGVLRVLYRHDWLDRVIRLLVMRQELLDAGCPHRAFGQSEASLQVRPLQVALCRQRRVSTPFGPDALGIYVYLRGMLFLVCNRTGR